MRLVHLADIHLGFRQYQRQTPGGINQREHDVALSLKRVIDLTRIACAAQLLQNPGYSSGAVVRLLHFASSSHLASTARRIAGVTPGALGALGPRGVLAAFVRGNTRSRGR